MFMLSFLGSITVEAAISRIMEINMKRLFFSALMALFMLPATAKAKSASEYLGALDAAKQAYIQQWLQTPLIIRKATFVARPSGGFGVYSPKADNTFKAGEAMRVYAEPVGFGWGKSGNLYSIDFSVDFTISTPDGKVLGGRKAFQKLGMKSLVQNTEFFVSLTYTFSGIPVGKYVITTVLNDKNSGKSASFNLPITIVK
jgi:hypothetical protein